MHIIFNIKNKQMNSLKYKTCVSWLIKIINLGAKNVAVGRNGLKQTYVDKETFCFDYIDSFGK